MTSLRSAVIFDLDGVIVDSSALHLESWKRLAFEAGFRFDERAFQETFGLRNDGILRSVLDSGVTATEIGRLGTRKEEIFRAIARGRLHALPGAHECLTALREAGYLEGLASSAPRANVTMILGELGIREQFDAVVTGDDVTYGKPDPEAFLRVAAGLGTAPRRCVVVEDAAAGVEAAKRADMLAVAVTPGRPAPGLLGADLIVGGLDELSPQRVRRLLASRAEAAAPE